MPVRPWCSPTLPFRNLLVDQYADVDDQRVREILRGRLTDLECFRRTVATATFPEGID